MSKSSHVRVVARIRPMSEEERYCNASIHAVLPEAPPTPSSSKEVSSSEPRSPPRSGRKGPLAFLTPNRSKNKKGRGSFISPYRSSVEPSEEATPVIRNGQRPNARTPARPNFPSAQTQPDYGTAQSLTAQGKQFDYDAVFSPTATQKEVYERSVGDAVRRNIFRGYNTTIIAYGQTGSGKTYTMGGRRDAELALGADTSPSSSTNRKLVDAFPEHSEDPAPTSFAIAEDDGIIPRAIHELFKAKQRHESAGEVSMQLTYLEIYNDELRDLLADGGGSPSSLKLCDHGDDGVLVKGLTSIAVTAPDQVKQLMDAAATRRTTGSTRMNMRSSRSHAICSLLVTINPATHGDSSKNMSSRAEVISAKLTLVDLAGSERIKETGVVGMQQQESININKDLFVLGKVVSALAEQRKSNSTASHVPYRDSKLTRLLRDSLGGNCCTVMVACVSPADRNVDESVNTLRYAERARTITNSVKQNVVKAVMTPAECAAMRGENKKLKSRLLDFQQRIRYLEKKVEDADALTIMSTITNDDASLVESLDDDDDTDESVSQKSLDVKNVTLTSLDFEISEKKATIERLQAKAAGLEASISAQKNQLATAKSPESELPASQQFATQHQSAAALSRAKIEMVDLSKPALGYALRTNVLKEPSTKDASEMHDLKDKIRALSNLNEKLCEEIASQKVKINAFLQGEKDNEEKTNALVLQLQFEKKRLREHEERLQELQKELHQAVEERDNYRILNAILEEEKEVIKNSLSAKNEQVELERKRIGEREDELLQVQKELSEIVQDRDNYRMKFDVQADELDKMKERLAARDEQVKEIEKLRVALVLSKEETLALTRTIEEKENLLAAKKGQTVKEDPRKVLSTCTSLKVNKPKDQSSKISDKLAKTNSSASRDTVSVQRPIKDSSSIDTGGQNSGKSDHNAIRVQAAKMLFFANKAIERGRGSASVCSSLASSNGSEFLPDLKNMQPTANKSGSIRAPTPGKPPRARSRRSPVKAPATDEEDHGPVISNLHQLKSMNRCSCNATLFSGKPEHVQFYLPKLGISCSCGNGVHDDDSADINELNDEQDPLALSTILRPWQVDFLKSENINTADDLVVAYTAMGDALAKKMRKWRKAQKLVSVKTKSCGIALHIWHRTCKATIASVEKQRAEGVKHLKRPGILEVSVVSDNRTAVSSLGCGSTFELGSHVEL